MSSGHTLRFVARKLVQMRRAPSGGALRALHRFSQHVEPHARATQPALCSRRHFATPPPQVNHSDLPIQEYHRYSDATMDRMLEGLENLLDDVGDPTYEVEYGSGVLTLKLGSHGTYVINKQPPNKQIWLSSPFSGPKRYDYVLEQDGWIYSRDARSLNDLLNQELSDCLERKVDLGLANVSTQVD